jgi:glutamyl-tRNA reductase
MAESDLVLLGVDHHQSPVSLREALSIGAAELPQALHELQGLRGVEESFILSTCNRTELLVSGSCSPSALQDFLAARQVISPQLLKTHSYIHEGSAAARHLFRVASSLESMVVGEYQIQHQVKSAYEQAVSNDTVGPRVHRLCQAALQCGKRVRSETALGKHRLSVASVAVDLIRQVHDRLDRCQLVLVGAGEMTSLCATHLFEAGVKKITVVNRSRERAEAFVQQVPEGLQAAVASWRNLPQALATADIVISGTSASAPVITTDMVRELRRRPQVYIDLAVPRDVEADVGNLVEVYSFNVDDLDRVVAANKQLRQDEVVEAETLVEQVYTEWNQQADDRHRELAKRVGVLCHELVGQEWEELAPFVRDPATAEQVERALRRLGKRFQHRLMQVLKTGESEERQEARSTVTRLLEVSDRRSARPETDQASVS